MPKNMNTKNTLIGRKKIPFAAMVVKRRYFQRVMSIRLQKENG
jgi:hypothetical protein